MHDIDRAMFEVVQEGFDEAEAYQAHNRVEALEVQLAAELLEVADEEELDQFLGDLVSRAASAAKGFAGSSTGQALTGLLKKSVKSALPRAGQIVGDAFGSGGGQVGAAAGRWLAGQFESEGLSGEDSELAGARALVQTATQATKSAMSAGPGAPPLPTASRALVAAANRNLPGLVPAVRRAMQDAGPGTKRPAGRAASGRWVRRGTRIVLLDL